MSTNSVSENIKRFNSVGSNDKSSAPSKKSIPGSPSTSKETGQKPPPAQTSTPPASSSEKLRTRTDSLMIAKEEMEKEREAMEAEMKLLKEARERRAGQTPTKTTMNSSSPDLLKVSNSLLSPTSSSSTTTSSSKRSSSPGKTPTTSAIPSPDPGTKPDVSKKSKRSSPGSSHSGASPSSSQSDLSQMDSTKGDDEEFTNAKPVDAITEERMKRAILGRSQNTIAPIPGSSNSNNTAEESKPSKTPTRPPPKVLKPRDYHTTLRKIVHFPPINPADFREEWDKFPNSVCVEVLDEPSEAIRPRECIAVRIKLVKSDDRSEVKIRSASFYRLATNNGIVFNLKLQEGQVYLLLRLVKGDEELQLALPGDSGVANVLHTQEYVRNKNSSAYYRPKAHSVFNTPLGVHLDRNQLDLFIKVMIPSPDDSSPQERSLSDSSNGISMNEKGTPLPFRILFNTINNQENEFSLTRKFFVSEDGPRVNKKSHLKEMLQFIKGIDSRSVALVEKVRQIEKLNKDSDAVKQLSLLKELVGSLVDTVPGATSKQNYNGRTLLHYMCALGLSDLVKLLVVKMKVPEINLLDINTRTALFMAIESGHKGIVKALLERGATWHTKDTRGETVTDFALRAGHINILHLLNDVKQKKISEATSSTNGDPPSEVDEDMHEPKIHSLVKDPSQFDAFKKHVDLMKRMSVGPGGTKVQTTIKGVKRVRLIDAVNEDGATAMHVAAANGFHQALNVLIAAGADINAKDDDGSTPLHQAVAAKQLLCVQSLANADGIDLEARDASLATPLNVAATLDLLAIVQLLISQKAQLDAGDERDFTPLHHACAYGYTDVVTCLLEAGADPNAATLIDDTTPFHQATFNGHHELLELLLQHGADLSSGNDRALDLACLNGHKKCVEILLTHKANPNNTDFEMSTPAHKAALNGHLECLKLLVKAGASIGAKDAEGSTPLHKAALAGNPKVVSYLLKQPNIAVNERDNYQGSALHNAAFSGHHAIVKQLIDAGAKLDITEDLGAAPLHLAALNGHSECVNALIVGATARADSKAVLKAILDKPDRVGMTALMHSVPYPEIVGALAAAGASVNLQDAEGKTAFFHAIMKRYEVSAKILIESGADALLKNKAGQIPLDLVSNEFKEMIHDAIKLRKQGTNADTEKKWKDTVTRFNVKAKEGIAHGVKEGLFEDTPDGIAMFLLKENETLNPSFVGELLGHRNRTELLTAFVKRLNFEELSLVDALRQFLQLFLLPGEAQVIERFMETFSARYVENNPSVFPNADTAFVFSFGLIMLNTDAHNKNIPAERKMSKAQFIYNYRGLWGPQQENPPQELMDYFYDAIVNDEIKFRDSGQAEEKEGSLKKQSAGFGSSTAYWFMLKDQCLFYFKQKSDAEPVGLIPLEGVQVKYKEGKKSTKFTLQAADGGMLKSCKMSKGAIIQGTAHEITIIAEKHEEAEAWVGAINSQIRSNPFYLAISQRSAEIATQHRGKGALYGVGAIVNFPEFYDLALLCDSCYAAESQVKKQYGTTAVCCVAECRGVRLFMLKDVSAKKFHLILGGNLWTEKVKRAEWYDTLDWRDHFKIDSIVESIINIIEDHLKKEFMIQITGHSLGALVAAFIANALHLQGYKLGKITTFGQPNFISEKDTSEFRTLNIIKIIDINDPADSVFAGHVHVGHLVTLLNKNNFCYETKIHPIDAPPEVSVPADTGGKKKGQTNRSADWKEKRNLKTGLSVDSRLPAHTIDYYLKRIKLKLKVETQYVEPANKGQFK